MSVLITIAVLTAAGLMAIGTYARLLRLRRQVIDQWREVNRLRRTVSPEGRRADGVAPEPDDPRAGDAAEAIYNHAARRYNDALETFPFNIVAGLAGFKRAAVVTDAAKVDSSRVHS